MGALRDSMDDYLAQWVVDWVVAWEEVVLCVMA
jgi:hypothetical protein